METEEEVINQNMVNGPVGVIKSIVSMTVLTWNCTSIGCRGFSNLINDLIVNHNVSVVKSCKCE